MALPAHTTSRTCGQCHTVTAKWSRLSSATEAAQDTGSGGSDPRARGPRPEERPGARNMTATARNARQHRRNPVGGVRPQDVRAVRWPDSLLPEGPARTTTAHVSEEVTAMRDRWGLTWRRHVDLARVASALCRRTR
ncbi:putative leader peptide [Streptomyces sp. DW26H14]|uniref:putative leader peptide n=1 Tax=Streptomyces sp. DW26H14 TaxID=3435395 RepID=UPI00403D6176